VLISFVPHLRDPFVELSSFLLSSISLPGVRLNIAHCRAFVLTSLIDNLPFFRSFPLSIFSASSILFFRRGFLSRFACFDQDYFFPCDPPSFSFVGRSLAKTFLVPLFLPRLDNHPGARTLTNGFFYNPSLSFSSWSFLGPPRADCCLSCRGFSGFSYLILPQPSFYLTPFFSSPFPRNLFFSRSLQRMQNPPRRRDSTAELGARFFYRRPCLSFPSIRFSPRSLLFLSTPPPFSSSIVVSIGLQAFFQAIAFLLKPFLPLNDSFSTVTVLSLLLPYLYILILLFFLRQLRIILLL